MKMKLLSITMITFTALFFSACGGGEEDAHFKNSEEKISIIDCNTSGAIIPDDFISMFSGDVLVHELPNTVITTYHDINGTKKVCTDSGKAYLIRK